MKEKTGPGVPAELQGMVRDFERWRSGKRKGERIPEELWERATRVAKEYGVYRVSRELSLDYVCLKGRVMDAGGKGKGAGQIEGQSVSMRAPNLESEFVDVTSVVGEPGSVCVIDLSKRNGTRLRISLGQPGSIDWDRVKEAFLGA